MYRKANESVRRKNCLLWQKEAGPKWEGRCKKYNQSVGVAVVGLFGSPMRCQ